MHFTKPLLSLFFFIFIPSTSIAQSANLAEDRYYNPYSKSECFGMFSPAKTPTPEQQVLLQSFARPDRVTLIAENRMNDAVNRHRVQQCIAMKQGLEPESCPVGDTIFFEPFLDAVIEEFRGADGVTIAEAMRSDEGFLSRDDILEACAK